MGAGFEPRYTVAAGLCLHAGPVSVSPINSCLKGTRRGRGEQDGPPLGHMPE